MMRCCWGVGALALTALSGERIFAQANDPNAYPNPTSAGELGEAAAGRIWGSDHRIEIAIPTARACGLRSLAANNCELRRSTRS